MFLPGFLSTLILPSFVNVLSNMSFPLSCCISDFGNPSCQPQISGAAEAKPAKPLTEKERSLMQTSLLGLDIKPKSEGDHFENFEATTKKTWKAWQVFKTRLFFVMHHS